VVPFGALAAMCVAEMVVIIGNWHQFIALLAAQSNASDDATLTLLLAAGAYFLVLSVTAFMMLLPGAIGAVIAEALALRSWIYHAANGGISAWVGWSMMSDVRADHHLYDQPTVTIAAGLAAGLVYWLIAGWSAGFWKPVFEPRAAAVVASPRAPGT
jgi:hypothetical protein